jgi:hypothetical protein
MDAFVVPRYPPTTTKSLSKALLESSILYCNRIPSSSSSSSSSSVANLKITSQHSQFRPILLPPHIPLTKSCSSWIIHVPHFFRPPSWQDFKKIWETHPLQYHPIKVYGKMLKENRYSQLYSNFDGWTVPGTDAEQNISKDKEVEDSYSYSGTSRPFIPCDPSKEEELFIMNLCNVADHILVNQLMEKGLVKQQASSSTIPSTNKNVSRQRFYNCCLMNWYHPEHHIGLHSDDESKMDLSVPIMSLSWGGPRRFVLRPKPHMHKAEVLVSPLYEVLLQDGDLLIMGGKCQQEFKHEVPKLRKKDGLVVDRISWTIRCVKPSLGGSKKMKKMNSGNKHQDASSAGVKKRKMVTCIVKKP